MCAIFLNGHSREYEDGSHQDNFGEIPEIFPAVESQTWISFSS
jgi:hypothetical protein